MTPPPAAPLHRESRDRRGNLLGTRSAAAAGALEDALAHLLSEGPDPVGALAAAQAADPAWPLPRLVQAGAHLALGHAADRAAAAALLTGLAPHLRQASPREQRHHAALQAVLDGRWAQACRQWDEHLIEHPRDPLALFWAHHWDHLRGDADSLRRRPARALPEWDDADPLFPAMLGLYAFGLAETGQFALAEELGRRAAARGPQALAVHAVAHVMESQGRFEDGAAWLRQQQQAWGEGARLGPHLWWHLALFRLETMDLPGALRLVDTHLSGPALQHPAHVVDAVALYWRLHLLGQDVDALCRAALATWQPVLEEAGAQAFVDWHVVMAQLGAGQRAAAEAWVARCAERLMSGDDAGRCNQAVARDVGLPLMRALLLADRGDPDAATRLLYDVHEQSARLGGSRVQRDLIAQTLMAVAARSAQPRVGRAVLNERCLAKPLTPLTRHWADRLGVQLA